MSTDRDTTRIVRSWLRTAEHESADRVLGTVLDRLDATPQRRATWWPARRLPELNNTAKLVLGAAAVVVAALHPPAARRPKPGRARCPAAVRGREQRLFSRAPDSRPGRRMRLASTGLG